MSMHHHHCVDCFFRALEASFVSGRPESFRIEEQKDPPDLPPVPSAPPVPGLPPVPDSAEEPRDEPDQRQG